MQEFAGTGENSIYEFNALGVLALYGDFLDGTPNCTLMVIGSHPLGKDAIGALEASADRLGYGKDGIAWVSLHAPDTAQGIGVKIASEDLWSIVEGMDPISIVATDIAATSTLSKAYGVSIKVNESDRAAGRSVVAFGDFSMMLKDEDSKQRAWHTLKTLKNE